MVEEAAGRVAAQRERADALLQAGDRLGARDAYSQALVVAEHELGPGHRELVLLHNGLGVTAKFTGEVDVAAHHYARALELVEGRDDADDLLGGLRHNLGGLAHTRGDLVEAEIQTRMALSHHTGVNPVAEAADRGQLGSIVSERGRHDEAIDLLEVAEAQFRDALGDDHLEVAIVQTTLGAALHRAGRLPEAARAYAAGLRIREATLGADHPELGPTLLNLGQLAVDQGDPALGAQYARRAVAVLEGHVVDDHPFLVLARERA